MITFHEKQKLESDFQKKIPSCLQAWSESHDKIVKIINSEKYKFGLEIGVMFGNHSESILKNTNVSLLHGIDPYSNYLDYVNDGSCLEQDLMDNIHDFAKKRLSFYNGRFNLIRDFSDNCVHLFEDNSLDFVYVDGNHYKEYVIRDIENYWQKVKVGGILSGHDYKHPVFPELTELVDEFCIRKNKKLEYLGTHVWCIFK